MLTVNHVFDILCEWYQTKSWKQALDKVIPERKQADKAATEVNKAANADQQSLLEESKEWLINSLS